MKQLLRATAILAPIIVALGACATDKDAGQETAFGLGKTTVADVESKLGQPSQHTATSTGFETLVYDQQHMTFIFAPNGKLKSFTQPTAPSSSAPSDMSSADEASADSRSVDSAPLPPAPPSNNGTRK